uniref:Uncharacterized protein n=1 Tax=Lygus hesperus TaxID=30085 RepID=A0A0K8T3U5_LYGHE
MGNKKVRSVFKPKHKRLVDKIYATQKGSTEVTLNNMDKLTYYSINYPEKVNKVATYFHEKIMKQIKKKKYQHIDVSLQALDVLLSSSPTQSYNLYAEHFLVVASQLLATNDQRLQDMATRSVGTQTTQDRH